MSAVLTSAQVQQFHERGFVFPIPVMLEEEAQSLRRRLEAVEASQGGALEPTQRSKSFLLFSWLDALIRDARVLDPVQQLIGPDILCWNTIFWIKNAGSKSFISWHQDTRYWGLSSDKVVTAWLALSPASIDSGCMRVMPGTHRGDVLPHRDTFAEDNMLTRGQSIIAGVNDDDAVYMPLRTGEMSMHNYRLAHASGPNISDDRRIGISLHFMPPDTEQIVGPWDCAALVRGEDRFHHFERPPVPERDFDAAAMEFHVRAIKAMNDVLYAGAQRGPPG